MEEKRDGLTDVQQRMVASVEAMTDIEVKRAAAEQAERERAEADRAEWEENQRQQREAREVTLALHERGVIAEERQAMAMERIAQALETLANGELLRAGR